MLNLISVRPLSPDSDLELDAHAGDVLAFAHARRHLQGFSLSPKRRTTRSDFPDRVANK